MFLNKLSSFLLVAVFTVIVAGQSADAAIWCSCSNNASKTQQSCSFAAGNFDGGSCGLDPVAKLDSFIYRCQSISGTVNCWA